MCGEELGQSVRSEVHEEEEEGPGLQDGDPPRDRRAGAGSGLSTSGQSPPGLRDGRRDGARSGIVSD